MTNIAAFAGRVRCIRYARSPHVRDGGNRSVADEVISSGRMLLVDVRQGYAAA
jgi:hypothetical protein